MRTFSKDISIAVIGLLLCLFALAGCDKQTGPGGAPPMGPPEVAVLDVQAESVRLSTELPGRVSASLVSEVRPQVSGIIQKRHFIEGSDVKAGDILYQIDPAPFQAALDNARAALTKAEASLPSLTSRYERYKSLIEDKAVSQQDFDDVSAALKQAKADVEYWNAAVQTAKINLAYARITAPVSGRIGKSNVTEGALVTINQPSPLAVIQKIDPIFVDVNQSSSELLRLRRSLDDGKIKQEGADRNSVSLKLEDKSAYPLKGTLQFQDITVDPSTGSVMLRIVFPNPKNTLLPGMFVRAEVQEGIKKDAILIPQQSVARDPKGIPYALVVTKEGKVDQRMLTIDRAVGDKWLVLSGLGKNDQVIVEGVQKARPGVAVKIVPFNKDKSTPAPPSTSNTETQKAGGR